MNRDRSLSTSLFKIATVWKHRFPHCVRVMWYAVIHTADGVIGFDARSHHYLFPRPRLARSELDVSGYQLISTWVEKTQNIQMKHACGFSLQRAHTHPRAHTQTQKHEPHLNYLSSSQTITSRNHMTLTNNLVPDLALLTQRPCDVQFHRVVL